MPTGVTGALEAWSSIWSNHAALRTAVTFAHVGGLVSGGGFAIVADRLTLAATRTSEAERRVHLRWLHATHRTVITGLVVIVVSGLLMFAADTDTFIHSKVFWLKMGLFTLLMLNGAVLVRAERRAEVNQPDVWQTLKYTAVVSLFLWWLTTLAGVALPNIG